MIAKAVAQQQAEPAMTLNLSLPGQEELKPRITVFGVGGAGGNAVNNMIDKSLEGADFVVANTDAQALQQNTAPNKIQIGIKVTEGLGAGARAEVGAAAAEESIEQIVDHLAGSHIQIAFHLYVLMDHVALDHNFFFLRLCPDQRLDL